MFDVNKLIGSHDVLYVTLDTLRYDVARAALSEGRTPGFAQILPNGLWQERHSPGNFTYAAHQAFFAGFLPTPATPGKHPRPFAVRFPGSETTVRETCVFDAPDIVHGLHERGYHTACIGGVGFFNKRSPLGSVLPNLFAESHWQENFGVTDPRSTENQVARAREIIERLPAQQRLFLFLNVSAIHQPNYFYLPGAVNDSLQSHAAALAYVDRHVTALIAMMRRRAPLFGILCSDHGTAYGEDGYWGHRLCHPVVWTVPYAEFVLPRIVS
jgi:sulfatase-like protein